MTFSGESTSEITCNLFMDFSRVPVLEQKGVREFQKIYWLAHNVVKQNNFLVFPKTLNKAVKHTLKHLFDLKKQQIANLTVQSSLVMKQQVALT